MTETADPIASSLCWHVLVHRNGSGPELIRNLDRKTAIEVARRISDQSEDCENPWGFQTLDWEAHQKSGVYWPESFSGAQPGQAQKIEVICPNGSSISRDEIWPRPADWDGSVARLAKLLTETPGVRYRRGRKEMTHG